MGFAVKDRYLSKRLRDSEGNRATCLCKMLSDKIGNISELKTLINNTLALSVDFQVVGGWVPATVQCALQLWIALDTIVAARCQNYRCVVSTKEYVFTSSLTFTKLKFELTRLQLLKFLSKYDQFSRRYWRKRWSVGYCIKIVGSVLGVCVVFKYSLHKFRETILHWKYQVIWAWCSFIEDIFLKISSQCWLNTRRSKGIQCMYCMSLTPSLLFLQSDWPPFYLYPALYQNTFEMIIVLEVLTKQFLLQSSPQ